MRRMLPFLLVTAACLLFRETAAASAGNPTLDDLRALLKSGEYARTETEARKLLALQERSAPTDAKGRIEILDILVQSLYRAGKAQEPGTDSLVQEELSLSRKEYGREDVLVARSLNNMGNVYFRTGNLPGAQSAWEEALAIRRKALGPEHPDVAASLNNLGLILEAKGEYAGALRMHEQAKAIREKALGPDHPDVATSLSNLGNALVRMGDYPAALEAQLRALAIREKALGSDHPRVSESLANLGIVYYSMRDYEHARPVYERSLAINEKVFGKDNPNLAIDKSNLGILLDNLGDYPAAKDRLEEGLALFQKSPGPDSPEVAYAFQNLSSVYMRLGRQADALAAAEKAVSIQEKASGLEHPGLAEVLDVLGNRYFEAGQFQKAAEIHRRAMGIFEKSLGAEHPALARTLEDLADAQIELGSMEQGRKNYERALSIHEKVFGSEHPMVGESLLKIAKLDWRTGSYPAALTNSLKGEKILRDEFTQLAPALSEREALQYEAARSSGINLSISSLLALAPAGRRTALPGVWDEVIRSRALVLDQMAARHSAFMSSGDPQVAAQAHALSSARNRLAHLTITGPDADSPSGYRSSLAAALAEKEEIERQLATLNAEFQRRRESAAMGFDDIAAMLPQRAALAAYVAYDRLSPGADAGKAPPGKRSYAAFVLRAGKTQPSVVELGEAKAIDARVQEWRERILPSQMGIAGLTTRQDEQVVAAGTRLRKAIWDPLASEIKGARMVFVVFDGALNLVNLAALPAGDERFVIESGPTLHYLGAERDLARRRLPSTATGGLLALGGPDFDAGPAEADAGKSSSLPGPKAHSSYRSAPVTCGGFATMRFTPLAASAREAESIESLWKSASKQPAASQTLVLTGSAATEAAMKQWASQFRVLHVATHGYFLNDRCDSSFNAARSAAESSIQAVSGESPLLLSGLALAGANRRTAAGAQDEDGVLTAEEIASLDLAGVDWAVLSACETGVGKIQLGEGVLGLRRAFEVAGAGSLIMSLWRVEDESTREWMQYLYQGRLAGLSTAEAVRQAGLSMIEKRRARGKSSNPGAWGAFVAAGDWR